MVSRSDPSVKSGWVPELEARCGRVWRRLISAGEERGCLTVRRCRTRPASRCHPWAGGLLPNVQGVFRLDRTPTTHRHRPVDVMIRGVGVGRSRRTGAAPVSYDLDETGAIVRSVDSWDAEQCSNALGIWPARVASVEAGRGQGVGGGSEPSNDGSSAISTRSMVTGSSGRASSSVGTSMMRSSVASDSASPMKPKKALTGSRAG